MKVLSATLAAITVLVVGPQGALGCTFPLAPFFDIFDFCFETLPPTPSPSISHAPTPPPDATSEPTISLAPTTASPTTISTFCNPVTVRRWFKYTVDSESVSEQRSAPGYTAADFSDLCSSENEETSFYSIFTRFRIEKLVDVQIEEGPVSYPVALIGINWPLLITSMVDEQRFNITRGVDITFSEQVEILSGATYQKNTDGEDIPNQVVIDGTGGSVRRNQLASYFTSAIMIKGTVESFTMIINGDLHFFAMAWNS